MKRLLKFLKKYIKECILGPLFKLIEASFELLVPLVVARIIDTDIACSDKAGAARDGGILILLGVLGLAFSVSAQYFSAKAAVGFAADLRRSLFAKIHSLSYSDIDEIGTASLITRMTGDVNTLQNGVNMVLRLFLRSPFIVFGAAAMAFTVDSRLALIFAVVIPLLTAVVYGIMLVTMPIFKKVQKKLEGVLGITGDMLSGARVIRAFCSEDEECERFTAENSELAKYQKRAGRLSALTNPLTYVIINGGLIILIWSGAIRVDAGLISVGAVIALYNYMSQILVELIKLANLIVTVTRSFACASRVADVLDIPQEKPKEANTESFPGKVCFKSVYAKYRTAAEESLEDITFTAEAGETVGIIGGTGSGKTTLVNLIPRFYDVCRGTVAVDGRDVRLWDESELRRKVGVVFQKAVLFKGSVRDNLLWGNEDADDEMLTAALKDAQAYDFVFEKSGLETTVESGGGNFSGGQRQRLTVARALVRRPEILILDDAGSALDFATDAALRHAIASLDYHPTVFTVTQRASSVMNADKIVVLDDGRAVGIGTHSELLNTCPVYREIYDSQFGGSSNAKNESTAGGGITA